MSLNRRPRPHYSGAVQYPDNLFDNRYIPEQIRDAFQAAAATKSIDSSISLIAWRRVLELTCKDLGAEGRNLYEQITDLSNKSILPSALKDASNLIRNLGNEGAHSTDLEGKWISISSIESLVRYIIEYVYILPEKIKEIANEDGNEKKS